MDNVLKNQKIFLVKTDRIGDFLGVLDPQESARITYRGFPFDDYLVVLDCGTTWETDDPDNTGITPVPADWTFTASTTP